MQKLFEELKMIDPHVDVSTLPEAAQRELVTFYEFLVFKYRGQPKHLQSDKQRILRAIFTEADGKLPPNYTFNREEVHER